MLLRHRHFSRHMDMRRTAHPACIAAAIVMIASPLTAQYQAGVKVGFGQSGYTGSSEFLWNSGPSSAGFLSYLFAPQFAVQLEASPVRRVGVSDVAGSSLTFAADYLSFPLLAQLRLPNASGVTPFVSAGPIFSMRLRCSLQFVGGGVETDDSCEGGSKAKTSPLAVAVGGGGGLERAFGLASFLVEGRASTGLTIERLPLDATRPRSFSWSLLGGVSFPLSRVSAPPSGAPVTPPVMAAATQTAPPSTPLPDISAVQVATAEPQAAPLSRDVLDAVGSTRRVSVNAQDADVRSLILLIARQGGVNVVVDPEVSGRVSISLTDVPVADALRAVIESAHLSVASATSGRAQPAVVFYQLPVNVNTAPASVIAARYGVSDELARWVAENQTKKATP
jgi:Outer membrane protein beta-barrel domain